MKQFISLFVVLFVGYSCSEETAEKDDFVSEKTEISTTFEADAFPSELHRTLLAELRICNPMETDSIIEGHVPCSPKYFAFYEYNNKRDLEDAFLLQVHQGVNNYPYRRLLIFVRENGKLVLMNGVNGYLVEKRSQPNGIDDLVVALVDNIEGRYMRYDVLLKYNDGKYHYKEALGDLQGVFDDPDLKKRATKEIGERIEEKELLF